MRFKTFLANGTALTFVAAMTALLASPALAQGTDTDAADEARTLGTVVAIGTRVANRTALDTPVAVDVVQAAQLENAGITELNQTLSVALPSFNFPRPALADGTDTIRPAGLRGLGPDQTLVLVNGKRRHIASLVNVNGTIGRGTSAVDLNTIPVGAVGSVEVLRDGASAQYGSDAIAGVINVRLKEEREGGNVTATYGWRESSYTVPVGTPPAGLPITVGNEVTRDRSDGHVLTVSGWQGLGLGAEGFLTVAGEYKTQDYSSRTGFDVRQQYPTQPDGSFFPGESVIDRFNARTGEPELDQITFFANAGYDLDNGVELYGLASYQNRVSETAGFFRRPLDARNVIEIYPNGFLPLINPTVDDLSLAGGARWMTAGWDFDASLVYGQNEMSFDIINTLNRSIGPASKTEFDAGGFQYGQLIANLSAVKPFDVGGLASPLNVAWGIEAREEYYEIFAGEPDSFRNGGVLLNGNPTASGSLVFPGFRPENEVDESRTAVGVYLDLEADVTDALLVSGAVRAETYSDFGETITGKLAARYDFTDAFALRGSVQNGFRAPSLQQQFFATTSTNFINGVPFDITTFPVTDPVAVALGAEPLDAEESLNLSLGGVVRALGWSVTVDGYAIDVDNRIVLSENLTQANVRAFLQTQGFIGSGGGRFFLNGVNTETRGVDIVGNTSWSSDSYGDFTLTLGANFNSTDVTAVPDVPELTALSPAPTLFGRVNVLTFEDGTPKDKFTGGLDWEMGKFGATARAIRYGEVLVPSATEANDYTLDPVTVIDLEARYTLLDAINIAVGADNVLDEYVNAAPISQNGTGNTPFSGYSPFGNSGRFVYFRVGYNW